MRTFFFVGVLSLGFLVLPTASECHYDFRLGQTKCTHHDGTVWTGGAKIEPREKKISPESSPQQRPIERSAAALAKANEMRARKRLDSGKKSPASSSTSQSPTKGSSSSKSSFKKSSSSSKVAWSSSWIGSCFDPSCRPWLDTGGKRIEAHGGGMLQHNSTFFWYGESEKKVDKTRGFGYSMGVNCYSAASLGGPWRHEGLVFGQSSIWVQELGDKDRPLIIERPKVLYNAKTGKFVMWFHLDAAEATSSPSSGGGWRRRLLQDETMERGEGIAPSQQQHRSLRGAKHHRYFFRRAGVAFADSPVGPFKFVHAVLPDDRPSLDMQLFEEPDRSAAFLIRSVNNEFVGMSRLSSDYLSTVGGILSTVRPCLEGMAVFRHPGDSTLYAVMSHLTGWEPNPLVLLRAHKTAPSGGVGERCQEGCSLDEASMWVPLGNPTHHQKSFNAQPTFVMSLLDRHSKPYVMLMSDNWLYAGPRGLKDAGYIWLPLEFRPEGMNIRKLRNWTMEAPFVYTPP